MKIKANLSEDVVMVGLTNHEADAKTGTTINIKGKNMRLMKKIQKTNLKSRATDVINLDTIPINVQTNVRIKTENNPILLKKTWSQHCLWQILLRMKKNDAKQNFDRMIRSRHK